MLTVDRWREHTCIRLELKKCLHVLFWPFPALGTCLWSSYNLNCSSQSPFFRRQKHQFQGISSLPTTQEREKERAARQMSMDRWVICHCCKIFILHCFFRAGKNTWPSHRWTRHYLTLLPQRILITIYWSSSNMLVIQDKKSLKHNIGRLKISHVLQQLLSKFAIKFSGKSFAIKHVAVHRCTFMERLRIRLNPVAKEPSEQSYIFHRGRKHLQKHLSRHLLFWIWKCPKTVLTTIANNTTYTGRYWSINWITWRWSRWWDGMKRNKARTYTVIG